MTLKNIKVLRTRVMKKKKKLGYEKNYFVSAGNGCGFPAFLTIAYC